jgi:zinc protease
VLQARGARVNEPGAVPFGALAARGFDPGYVALTAGARPTDVDTTVARLRAAVAEVLSTGVAADETARAANRLAGQRALELRSRAAVADAVALDEAFGLPPLSYRARPERLARVTAPDVVQAAHRVLDPQREAIAAIRPEAR